MLRRKALGIRGPRTGLIAFALLSVGIPASGQVATISIVDSAGDVGRDSAIAYGPDGLALISYVDATNGALKVAHCDDVACTTSVKTTLDASGAVSGSTGIAFGPDGRALISYQSGVALRVAHCADVVCSSATLSTVDAATAGVGTAIAVGTDGLAVLAYGGGGDVLRVAHCADADCAAAIITSFPTRFGRNPSVTIGGDGRPLVACDTGVHLHVGHCADLACTSATFVTILGIPVPGPGGIVRRNYGASLATRSDGLGIFAYTHFSADQLGESTRLAMRQCVDPACSALVPVPPTGGSSFQYESALALMPGNLPVVGSRAQEIPLPSPNRLMATLCPDAACSPSQNVLVDVAGTGWNPAVAVGPAGIALISHYDETNGDLKTAYLDRGGEISIGDVSVTEGDAGTTAAVFQVTRFGAGAASVDFATGGGTAQSGTDYLPATGTVTFPPGSSTQTVTVTVIGDLLLEPDETFLVTLSNPQGGTIVDGEGECTIVDDEVAPVPVVTELAHGSRYAGDLAAGPGPAANVDWFRLAQAPYASYEVVADALSGDVQPLELTRTAADGTTVLQTATADGAGFSLSLRWQASNMPVTTQFVRVRSGGCGTDCGPDDVYHLRAYETTLTGTRFNNSGTQTTVLLLQNPTDLPLDAAIHFWSPGGVLLATHLITPVLPAKAALTLNTSQVPGLAGKGGSVTVSHTAPYGALAGKTVALEPSTGFSFDTPLLPKSR